MLIQSRYHFPTIFKMPKSAFENRMSLIYEKWDNEILRSIFRLTNNQCTPCCILKFIVCDQYHTYPLWKTPTIAFTSPGVSSDKKDSVCFSVTVPSASNTSHPKAPAGSDVSNSFFTVWVSSVAIISTCDLLKTQI